MEFEISFLSFYVVTIEGNGEFAQRKYKHFQTLDKMDYQDSPLKNFLDGELAKVAKRKVDRHPKSEQVPTKIGYFITEPGHELDSNPNYNHFQKIRFAETKDDFQKENEAFVSAYVDTTAVRGGVFIIAQATLPKYFTDPFVFLLKCDFEPKVASISDEQTLIHNVELAITTKNMKSIQYPYMPETGILEEGEIKIHQASHARYFEDFLKFVDYEKSMPEILKNQVMDMVFQRVEETIPMEEEDQKKFEEAMEIWATSPKREIQERFSTDEIIEATNQIVEHTPDIELKMKADHISVKGLLADFGDSIHIGKVNNRYVVLIEAESLQFDKGISPIEFLKPDDLQDVILKIHNKTLNLM